jgi:hypothetical protein
MGQLKQNPPPQKKAGFSKYIKQMKRQTTNWKKVFQYTYLAKDWSLKHVKISYNLVIKKMTQAG